SQKSRRHDAGFVASTRLADTHPMNLMAAILTLFFRSRCDAQSPQPDLLPAQRRCATTEQRKRLHPGSLTVLENQALLGFDPFPKARRKERSALLPGRFAVSLSG